jgi:(E)-2-((N-methylformamido)methylene)succinate hydrolase
MTVIRWSDPMVGPRESLSVTAKDGIAIRYVAEGAGAAVMLIHGVGSNLESCDAIATVLVPRYRVIRLDLRGHGRSGRITTCTLQDFVDDALLVLEEQRVTSAHLAGFSLGGMIAQAFALQHPSRVDRLAFISAVAGRTPAERDAVLGRARKVREEGIASVAGAADQRWFTDAFRAAHPDIIRKRLEELKANDHASYAAAYEVFATGDLGERIRAIRHKTLIVTGENDVGSNPRMARFMHESIPGSRLEILPELRHSVLLEAPSTIARLLLEHFAR